MSSASSVGNGGQNTSSFGDVDVPLLLDILQLLFSKNCLSLFCAKRRPTLLLLPCYKAATAMSS